MRQRKVLQRRENIVSNSSNLIRPIKGVEKFGGIYSSLNPNEFYEKFLELIRSGIPEKISFDFEPKLGTPHLKMSHPLMELVRGEGVMLEASIDQLKNLTFSSMSKSNFIFLIPGVNYLVMFLKPEYEPEEFIFKVVDLKGFKVLVEANIGNISYFENKVDRWVIHDMMQVSPVKDSKSGLNTQFFTFHGWNSDNLELFYLDLKGKIPVLRYVGGIKIHLWDIEYIGGGILRGYEFDDDRASIYSGSGSDSGNEGDEDSAPTNVFNIEVVGI